MNARAEGDYTGHSIRPVSTIAIWKTLESQRSIQSPARAGVSVKCPASRGSGGILSPNLLHF